MSLASSAAAPAVTVPAAPVFTAVAARGAFNTRNGEDGLLLAISEGLGLQRTYRFVRFHRSRATIRPWSTWAAGTTVRARPCASLSPVTIAVRCSLV